MLASYPHVATPRVADRFAMHTHGQGDSKDPDPREAARRRSAVCAAAAGPLVHALRRPYTSGRPVFLLIFLFIL